ncbi:MAG: DNA-directed RNA polymerase [Candidatus Micrarchaeia archaeon]
MYNVITVQDRVRLPAQNFSMELKTGLSGILREKYERRIDKDAGIVLSVWNIQPQGDGRVIPSDGAAYYDVQFDALTYKPEVNEVVEADVSEVVEFGAFLGIGPIEGLIHLSQITNDFLNFNKRTASFVGKESKRSLKKGERVYAKITTVSIKSTLADTKIGLTMRPAGLGKDEWIQKIEKSGGEEKVAKAEKVEKGEKAAKPEKKKKEKEE